jgi:hypothetical protein
MDDKIGILQAAALVAQEFYYTIFSIGVRKSSIGISGT